MIIRKAEFPEELKEFVNFYRNKKLYETNKIKARWACGENIKHLFSISTSSLQDYSIFFVKIRDLINGIDFGEMKGIALNPKVLFNGVDERDWRIAKILNHWEKCEYIDPPEICMDCYSQNIDFSDGRHRTIAAFHLGEEKIPVIIHYTLFKNISSILELS